MTWTSNDKHLFPDSVGKGLWLVRANRRAYLHTGWQMMERLQGQSVILGFVAVPDWGIAVTDDHEVCRPSVNPTLRRVHTGARTGRCQ